MRKKIGKVNGKEGRSEKSRGREGMLDRESAYAFKVRKEDKGWRR